MWGKRHLKPAFFARVLPRLEKVRSETSPFTGPNAPRKTGDINWARPELTEADIQQEIRILESTGLVAGVGKIQPSSVLLKR